MVKKSFKFFLLGSCLSPYSLKYIFVATVELIIYLDYFSLIIHFIESTKKRMTLVTKEKHKGEDGIFP